MIDDPGLSVRDRLLGHEAIQILNAAVAPDEASCVAAKPVQVRYRPGRSLTVQYEATVAWKDGTETRETLVAQTGTVEGAAAFEVDGSPVSFWRYPHDPFLPGLAPAVDVDRALDLLTSLGVRPAGVTLRRRAYRPGRRAVVEVRSENVTIFLKVVRPQKVSEIQRIHRLMADRVPVPHSHGWVPDLGIVALQALPGETLRKAIGDGSPHLPTGLALTTLLDQLDHVPDIEDEVIGPLARIQNHVDLLSAVVPEQAGRLEALSETLVTPPEPTRLVHGDFHTSQIVTADGAIVGLIDLDTVGLGRLTDDLATLLGHVSSLSLGPSGEAFRSYGEELIGYFDRIVEPTDLRLATAAVVLGFATGPFRVLRDNWESETGDMLALAERWADSAAGA